MTGTYDGKPLKADLTDAEDQRVNASWSQATMQATNCQGKVGGQDVTLLKQGNQRKILGYHNTLYNRYSICFEGESCDESDDGEPPGGGGGSDILDLEVDNLSVSQDVPDGLMEESNLLEGRGIEVEADLQNNEHKDITIDVDLGVKGMNGAFYTTEIEVPAD